jgi:outer membrane protein TolC
MRPLLLLVLMAGVAGADEAPVKKRTTDLPTLIAHARRSAKVDAAHAVADAARAKADELDVFWIPQIELTAAGGPISEIRCSPSPDQCITTQPQTASIGWSGAFFHVEAKTMVPIYTFGKIAAGKRAASAGVRAAESLAAVSEADAVLDATKAYWGVKAARELIEMLEEGRDDVDDEIKRVTEALKKGSGEANLSDSHRLKSTRAEILARLSEAQKGERAALAAVRLFYGADDVDVDSTPMNAVAYDLGTRDDARAQAREHRPERKAAEAGLDAAANLVDVEKARWWPDVVAVAQGTIASASSVDTPQNAFFNNPFNVTSFTAGVALHWMMDFGQRPSKIAAARAQEAQARATAQLARDGVSADAERAWAEVADAKDRLEAARAGEKEARAWLVSTLQATEAGLVEPKELADALLAWFTMRARVIQATFDWNVGVMGLEKAMGLGMDVR